MAKVTWLGEDTEEIPGPSYNMWNGVKFKKDHPVEVTDAHMLMKARVNRFYKVTDDEAQETPKEEVLRKQEAEQYDTSGARDVTPKQETHHAQGKALERKAQELKSKIENKKEDYDFRKTEKGSGYSAAKRKSQKRRPHIVPEYPHPTHDQIAPTPTPPD